MIWHTDFLDPHFNLLKAAGHPGIKKRNKNFKKQQA